MAKLQSLKQHFAPLLRQRVLAAEKLERRIEKLRAEWNAADAKFDALNNEIAALKGMMGTQKELPTVEEIHGIDPDFTGGLDSVEYLRRMRGGDEPPCESEPFELSEPLVKREPQ